MIRRQISVDVSPACASISYDASDPPAHLVLGSDALRLVRAGREAVDHDFNTWEDLTLSTDFPRGQ